MARAHLKQANAILRARRSVTQALLTGFEVSCALKLRSHWMTHRKVDPEHAGHQNRVGDAGDEDIRLAAQIPAGSSMRVSRKSPQTPRARRLAGSSSPRRQGTLARKASCAAWRSCESRRTCSVLVRPPPSPSRMHLVSRASSQRDHRSALSTSLPTRENGSRPRRRR